MTTRKNVKERIDSKTGDIIRTSKETLKVWERVDATTGKVKDKVVSVEVQSPTPKARGAKAKRNEMIERVTKMVQDLEIIYATGNAIIECLKNYKLRFDVKRRKPKYFIPDKEKIYRLYDKKHNITTTARITPEVLDNELALLDEILKRIDEFELHEHWKRELQEKHSKLVALKPFVKQDSSIPSQTSPEVR